MNIFEIAAVPKTLYSGFIQIFEKFDKTLIFCGGGLVTSYFFVKNGEYVKLAIVGLLMAAVLSAWRLADSQQKSRGV